MAILIRFFPLCLFAQFSYFIPPAEWQCVQSKNPSPHVQVGFVGQGKSGFHPSINLAIEEVEVSLKDYVRAVKEIHLAQPTTNWRDLGAFSMKGGVGRLTEISSSSPWGPVQMLQALLVRERQAYILTAAVLREEFPHFRKEILQALKSLAFADDAASSLTNEEQKNRLRQALFSQEEPQKRWENLQQIVNECSHMGTHWQFLVLKEEYAKIFPSEAR